MRLKRSKYHKEHKSKRTIFHCRRNMHPINRTWNLYVFLSYCWKTNIKDMHFYAVIINGPESLYKFKSISSAMASDSVSLTCLVNKLVKFEYYRFLFAIFWYDLLWTILCLFLLFVNLYFYYDFLCWSFNTWFLLQC